MAVLLQSVASNRFENSFFNISLRRFNVVPKNGVLSFRVPTTRNLRFLLSFIGHPKKANGQFNANLNAKQNRR